VRNVFQRFNSPWQFASQRHFNVLRHLFQAGGPLLVQAYGAKLVLQVFGGRFGDHREGRELFDERRVEPSGSR